jgi:hypothetical protein
VKFSAHSSEPDGTVQPKHPMTTIGDAIDILFGGGMSSG